MEMNLRQEGLAVPASGTDFVPVGLSDLMVREDGGKCVHGVYIPSNHEDQNFARYCDICTSLKAFCEKNSMQQSQANIRLYVWINFDHEEAVTRLKQLEEERLAWQTQNSPSA
jgi:hypothetical protein